MHQRFKSIQVDRSIYRNESLHIVTSCNGKKTSVKNGKPISKLLAGRFHPDLLFLLHNYGQKIGSTLDSIISIVDVKQFFAHPEYPDLMQLKLRQVGFSDMVILNKVDLVDAAEVQKVRQSIEERLLRVRFVEAVNCEVPLEILLAVGRFDLSQIEEDHDHHTDHGQTFSTWSFETKQPLSLDSLTDMVKKRLPGSIYRCKGIVYTAEYPSHRVVLQAVGRRSDISLEDEWGDRQPRTQIVAIGAPGSIDETQLTSMFASCVQEADKN